MSRAPGAVREASAGEALDGSEVRAVAGRHAEEAALAGSEANFRELIENAPDAIGVYDRTGRHVYVNPRLATFLGYGREELLDKRVSELVHPDDLPMFAERNARREQGEQLSPVEYRLRHRDGRTLYAEIISMKVRFDGQPVALCILRDVTERKQMQIHLLQSHRLAAVGMLAGGLAHELNNPLSYVMTNLELLVRYALPEMDRLATTPEEKARVARALEMADHAKQGAERMARIVRDVKTFARGDTDDREPVDVVAVLESALQVVGHDLRGRADVVREFAPVPRVLANESRLGQVFLNLLVNAVHALEGLPAGEVRLRVSAPDAARVLVEVSDTGAGIAPDLLPRVFDPFFTTKPRGKGTGLGLFVCQGIVTSLDGTMDLESKLGKGTVVRVSLPALSSSRAR
ncbi:MAG TPA: ATP-binding protein [Polyangiaceae bacterium]|jgi:PAS domain S-box-containing protein